MEKSRTQMLYRPESVDHLTILELHLLMNNNVALNLDPEMVTYPPTSDSSLRAPATLEVGQPSATYMETIMPQLYETRHIEAAITEIDTQPRDLTRLA